MGDADEDEEADPLVTDVYTHVNFDWDLHVNEILKTVLPKECYEPISTGQLKMVPRILMWIVSHILCPKNGAFSRIDFA